MKKKEINICDICEDKVSKHKCGVCERDVCDDCYKIAQIDIINKAMAKVIVCESCEIALEKALNESGIKLLEEQITPAILAALKKLVMLEHVDKKEIKEKKSNRKKIEEMRKRLDDFGDNWTRRPLPWYSKLTRWVNGKPKEKKDVYF